MFVVIYGFVFLRCGNTSNNIVQGVAQHCCIASCRANVPRITTARNKLSLLQRVERASTSCNKVAQQEIGW